MSSRMRVHNHRYYHQRLTGRIGETSHVVLSTHNRTIAAAHLVHAPHKPEGGVPKQVRAHKNTLHRTEQK